MRTTKSGPALQPKRGLGRVALAVLMSWLLAGCLAAPPKVPPVQPFELPRYLGTWYEVARLDNWFERGMEQVTAEYSLRDDGGVRVRNRGYLSAKGEWEEAIGKAYAVGAADVAHLKVSFFGPFYGHYVVFGLDADYRHAFVASDDHSYLWLLSRTPTVSDAVRAEFVQRAKALGYPVEQLVWVKQGVVAAP